MLNKYLDENPGATSSDVIYFVSSQPDFFEDSQKPKIEEKLGDSVRKAVDMFSTDFMEDGRPEQTEVRDMTAYAVSLERKGHETGIEEGKRIERNELLAVVELLQKEGRNNEISRAISDPAFREKLLVEIRD